MDDRQAPQAPPSVEIEAPQLPVLDQQPDVLPESSDTTGGEEGEELVNLMQPQVRKKEKGKKKAKKNGKGGKTRDEPLDEVKAEVRCDADLIHERTIVCTWYKVLVIPESC